VLVRLRADGARTTQAFMARAPRAWVAALVAVAGGGALWAASPPVGFWPLAAAGPALLAIALWRRSVRGSFLVGLAFGAAFFFPLLSWVLNVAWYAWAGLAAADTLILAALAVGQRLLLRLPAWPVAVAGWWVAAESLRDRWPWGGFPWGRLAMSQASAPTVHWVAVAGPSLLTFLVALAGACLAWLVLGPGGYPLRRGRARPAGDRDVAAAGQASSSAGDSSAGRGSSGRGPATSADGPEGPAAGRDEELAAGQAGPEGDGGNTAGAGRAAGPVGGRVATGVRRRIAPALCLAGALLLALAGPLLPVDEGAAGTPTAVVAAVQGNVPHARSLPDLLRANTVTTNHANATLRFAARVRAGREPAPDVVIWPENSTDQDPRLNPFIYSSIARAVDAIRRPVLVGAVLQNPVRNAGQLWLPGRGPVQSYIKRKLVPFGEVIPFRAFLSLFTSLPALQPVNFTPGHRAVVFRLGKIRLGDVICYEVGFDGLVSSEVARGANLLTVQTNDADFELDGQTGETLQQLAMAQVRAVEHNRAVVVASTTGVSAIIAPDGRFLARTGIWQRAVIEARVPLRTSTTLADRLGGWPEGILTGATVAVLAWMLALAVADRRRTGRG
jgi:apolipoprotein N-acyltransferase